MKARKQKKTLTFLDKPQLFNTEAKLSLTPIVILVIQIRMF